MMSHELRTPMNGIIGSLDLMGLSELDEDNQELLETASISANNLVFTHDGVNVSHLYQHNWVRSYTLQICRSRSSKMHILLSLTRIYIVFFLFFFVI